MEKGNLPKKANEVIKKAMLSTDDIYEELGTICEKNFKPGNLGGEEKVLMFNEGDKKNNIEKGKAYYKKYIKILKKIFCFNGKPKKEVGLGIDCATIILEGLSSVAELNQEEILLFAALIFKEKLDDFCKESE